MSLRKEIAVKAVEKSSLAGKVSAQGEEGRTYCQLASKEVSSSTCEATQGQEGCFGCASAFRRCETCKLQLVAVPAVGLCSACLQEALRQEEHRQPQALPQRVQCQIVGKEIRVTMCEATQGQEGCSDCTAVSRKCETCKQRFVRFPRYGLCLHCTVAELGDGWSPSDISPQPRLFAAPVAQPNSTQSGVDATVQRLKALGLNVREMNASSLAEVMGMSQEEAEDIFALMKQSGIVEPRESTRRDEMRVVPIPRAGMSHPPLLKRVCDEIMDHQVATPSKVAHALQISEHAAEQVLSVLEEIRVLSPKRADQSRKILVVKQRARKLINLYLMRAEKKRRAIEKGSAANKVSNSSLAFEACYTKVRAFILESRTSSRHAICRGLQLSRNVVTIALERLEQEGVLGPAPGPREPRPILVEGPSPRETAAAHHKAVSTSQKIQKLQQLIRTLGEDTQLGQILRSVIGDVEELKRLKYDLHQITRKR